MDLTKSCNSLDIIFELSSFVKGNVFLFPKWRHDYLYAELLSGKTLFYTSAQPCSAHNSCLLIPVVEFGGFYRDASFGEKLGKIACYCRCTLIGRLSPKTRLHLAKAKILFDVCRLFFDLLC